MLLLALSSGCRYTGPDRHDDGYVGEDTPEVPQEDTIRACAPGRDRDGDGWQSPLDGGSDCDDLDADVHPEATDTAADGLDADCDGEDAPTACIPSPETCDGTDEDCDGTVDDRVLLTLDVGWTVVSGALLEGGAPAIVVGGEDGGDGWVKVYDATGTEVVTIAGTGQSQSFGEVLATGRDLTGDGVVDLVIAAPWAFVEKEPNQGRIFVFAGPIGPDTTLEDAVGTFEGGELDGQPGTSLALLPDLTGDGLAELAFGYYRFAVLFSGAPPVGGRLADAVATLEMNTGGGTWTFADAPDADGDTLPELLMGMSTYAGTGMVGRWNSGGLSGTLGAADQTWVGTDGALGGALARVEDTVWSLAGTTPVILADAVTASDEVATGLAAAGDIDGDGVEDLLLATSEGVRVEGLGAWPYAASLAPDGSLGAPVDLDGDAVPDPIVVQDGVAYVLEGGAAFTDGCDADGDGVSLADDCDDGDPDARPGAPEACDGDDDDCDGVIDAPAEAAFPGRAVHADGLGDLDGDGGDELAWLDGDGLITAMDGEDTLSVRTTVTGGRATVASAFAGLGDQDGDGFPDMIVSGEEAAWILPAGAQGDAAELADAAVLDGTRWLRTGPVGLAGDHDGDGVPDPWVEVQTLGGQRALAVFAGPVVGQPSADDADWLLVAPATWDLLVVAGAHVGRGADLDGDGRDDLLVGDPRSAYGDGRAFVVLDPPAGEGLLDETAALVLYGETGETMGGSLAIGPDLDGDGQDDALLGGATGTRLLSGGTCPLLGGTRWDVPSDGVALLDLDGDGAVEAWFADADAESGRGALWQATWGHPATRVRLGEVGEGLGSALWDVGDTDGTGGADLVFRTATGSARLGASCR